VITGSHDLSLNREPHRLIIDSKEFIVHPNWNKTTLANDIALIKLPEKIQFNSKIFLFRLTLPQNYLLVNRKYSS